MHDVLHIHDVLNTTYTCRTYHMYMTSCIPHIHDVLHTTYTCPTYHMYMPYIPHTLCLTYHIYMTSYIPHMQRLVLNSCSTTSYTHICRGSCWCFVAQILCWRLEAQHLIHTSAGVRADFLKHNVLYTHLQRLVLMFCCTNSVLTSWCTMSYTHICRGSCWLPEAQRLIHTSAEACADVLLHKLCADVLMHNVLYTYLQRLVLTSCRITSYTYLQRLVLTSCSTTSYTHPQRLVLTSRSANLNPPDKPQNIAVIYHYITNTHRRTFLRRLLRPVIASLRHSS